VTTNSKHEAQVKTPLIDTSHIEAMVSQLRAAGARSQVGSLSGQIDGPGKSTGFADVLKASLEQVDRRQQVAQQLGQDFALGDDKTNLSDVMIAVQKASISLQAAVQVRNKLVSAYHEIMNMQV
jgi:flagellar hook-basal body complex protein FliE